MDLHDSRLIVLFFIRSMSAYFPALEYQIAHVSSLVTNKRALTG